MLLIHKSFNTAMDALSPQERQMLRARFCDPIMHKFLDAQVSEALAQTQGLDPSDFPVERAQEFLQAAKDARAVWQFWAEFRNFVRDWSEDIGAH